MAINPATTPKIRPSAAARGQSGLSTASFDPLKSKPSPHTVMSAPQINGKKPLSGPNDPVNPSDQELTMVARPSRHQNTFKMRSNINGTTRHLVPKILCAAPAFLRWLVFSLARKKQAESVLSRQPIAESVYSPATLAVSIQTHAHD